MRAFIRSLVFTAAFYAYSLSASVLLSWSFFFSRKVAFWAILQYFKGATWVERLFLGLDYRVTGLENLPPAGTPYILALKHYSTYETLKVPVIFGDIAIILKKELTWIPFWGWYTLKTEMIPVDRGAGNKAIASLIKGAKRVVAQGRPILIFPQGTRVRPDETTKEKPYKVGIAKIAHTLNLPIVPVALNSGAFWPKHGFIKRGGIAEFKILPMIPAGLAPAEALKALEDCIEPASAELMRKAKTDKKYIKSYWPKWIGRLVRPVFKLAVVWTLLWYGLAYAAEYGLAYALTPRAGTDPLPISSPYKPKIVGYPTAFTISWREVTIETPDMRAHAPSVEFDFLPLPGAAISLSLPKGVDFESTAAQNALSVTLEKAQLRARLPVLWEPQETWALAITGADVTYSTTQLVSEGSIGLPLDPVRAINGVLQVNVSGYAALFEELTSKGVLDADRARTAKAFMDTMAATQGGSDSLGFPLKVVDNVVYAGFVRLYEITRATPPEDVFLTPQQKNHSGDLGTGSFPAPDAQTPLPDPQP